MLHHWRNALLDLRVPPSLANYFARKHRFIRVSAPTKGWGALRETSLSIFDRNEEKNATRLTVKMIAIRRALVIEAGSAAPRLLAHQPHGGG
jgi:hypothetical protein